MFQIKVYDFPILPGRSRKAWARLRLRNRRNRITFDQNAALDRAVTRVNLNCSFS